MNYKCKVSVIILSYFHEEYIERALDSVLSQQCTFDFEVIVSDDASKDRTVEIVKEYKSNTDQRIKLLERENNVGITRNLYSAYLNCEGKYIVNMAGDDTYTDSLKLQKQVDFLEDKFNQDYFGVGTVVKQVYSNGEETGLIVPNKLYWGKEFTKEQFLAGINYPTHGLMIKNIFYNPETCEEAKNKFKLMCDFSKYIDDLTSCFFFFDYGKIFILKDITYAALTRRQGDENQHNYNSIRNKEQVIEDHLLVLKNVQKYYGKELNLQKRFESYINGCFFIAVSNKSIKSLRLLKEVPVKYIIPSLVSGFKRKLLIGRCKGCR